MLTDGVVVGGEAVWPQAAEWAKIAKVFAVAFGPGILERRKHKAEANESPVT